MRRRLKIGQLAILASLLFMSPGHAEVGASFDSPMIVWGEGTFVADGAGHWDVHGGASEVSLFLPAGTRVEETVTYLNPDSIYLVSAPAYTESHQYFVDRDGWANGSVSAEVRGFWATANVDGDFQSAEPVAFSVQATPGEAEVSGADWLNTESVWMSGPESARWNLTFQSGTSMRLPDPQLECSGMSTCPGRWSPTAPNPDPSSMRTVRTVHVWGAFHGDMRIQDSTVSMGAQGFDVGGTLAARLPNAAGEICKSIQCPDNGTLSLEGTLSVDGIHPMPNDRMTAMLSGDMTHVRVDSEIVQWPYTAAVAASTMGLAALAALASKFGFFALFTRLKPEQALEHPRRELLYAYIQEKPGATFREIVRETGVPAGTTRHHLTVLRRSELVVEKKHKSTLRFFENHGKYDATWDTVVMLREEPLQQLHAWLKDNPATKQKDIVAAMVQGRRWSRGTTQHRLSRLVDARLVTIREQGRLKLYTAHDAPQEWAPSDRWSDSNYA